MRDGRYTGSVAGTPCFRERQAGAPGPVARRPGPAPRPSSPQSTCYSDSHNDLPLLERVTRPVAVDPDERLADEASAAGLGDDIAPVESPPA